MVVGDKPCGCVPLAEQIRALRHEITVRDTETMELRSQLDALIYREREERAGAG